MSRRRRRGGPAGHGPARKNGRRAASARHDTSSRAPSPAALAEPTGEVVIGDGVIAVPDVILIEGAAHKLPTPVTFSLVRDGGRSVAFYRWSGSAA